VRPCALAPIPLTAVCWLLAFAAPAAAEPAAAILPGNVLATFDTASPANVTQVTVTGLGANQTIRGIDSRPATGDVSVSAVTTGAAANSVIFTYRVDTNTGVATFVGQTAAALAGAADVPTGYDFNPVVDRIRYVNTNDENARLVPDNAALAGNDTDLTPAAVTTIIAEAYDRNQAGATATTLYAIDRNDSQLGIQGGINGAPSPNGGVVTDIAPLGFNLNQTTDGGFDISRSGVAYAALTSAADNRTRLYRLNLPTSVTATPVATELGPVGAGLTEVRALTVIDPDLDADGVRAGADNCDSVVNADQADLDGDGQGDACDSDQDGDGLPDAVEAQLRTDPRATDTDGDGRPDGADSCPTLAAATANGCPDPPLPALDFAIRGFPQRIALRTLRTRGVSLTVEPNRAAAFVVELRGRLRGSRIARVRDFVVAERRLRSAAGRRRVRLVVPRSERRRLRRGSRFTLRVIATDATGQSQIATRRLTVRRASKRQSAPHARSN
jgi:Domain of unknown function (DUF4394)/Thrombospondin type 3 repeat